MRDDISVRIVIENNEPKALVTMCPPLRDGETMNVTVELLGGVAQSAYATRYTSSTWSQP